MVAADSGTIKFLCSYNGIIAPRSSDGLLRYFGGLTRILAVNRSISYTELMVKLVEFCGFSVDLKCSLPGGDLETLVTIKSQEELDNLMEEYDGAGKAESKIRAVLTPPKSLKTISPTPSVALGSYYSPTITCRAGSTRRPSRGNPMAVRFPMSSVGSPPCCCNTTPRSDYRSLLELIIRTAN